MTKDELTKKTVKELLVLAKRYRLRGASRLRKAQLITKLLAVAPQPGAPPKTSRGRAKQPRRGSGKTSTDLTRQTRKQLLDLARQRGLTGVSRLRKEQLLARLGEVSFTVPPTVPLPHMPQEHELISPAEFAPLPEPPPESTAPVAAPAPQSTTPPVQELPAAYQDNRVVLLARDPHHLYAYWDVSPEPPSVAPPRPDGQDARLVVRVVEVTEAGTNDASGKSVAALELTPAVLEWDIPVPQPSASYRVEIGYQTREGHFTPFSRSNVTSMPRAEVSPRTEVSWFTPSGSIPSPLPPLRQPPLPLSATDQTPGSVPVGQRGREALPAMPAVSSPAPPLFSWSLHR